MLKTIISSMANYRAWQELYNGHLNILYMYMYLVKGVCQQSYVRWQALQEAVSGGLFSICLAI